jgi:hypothetical protein
VGTRTVEHAQHRAWGDDDDAAAEGGVEHAKHRVRSDDDAAAEEGVGHETGAVITEIETETGAVVNGDASGLCGVVQAGCRTVWCGAARDCVGGLPDGKRAPRGQHSAASWRRKRAARAAQGGANPETVGADPDDGDNDWCGEGVDPDDGDNDWCGGGVERDDVSERR